MIVLGVTGSIGMGKSTVSNMLRDMGIPVHDSDASVHGLLGPNGAAVEHVAHVFPETLSIDDAGRPFIDRQALGRIVFNDAAKKKELEDLLHPLVRAESDKFLDEMKKQGHAIAVLDIPLLFETGSESRVHQIVVVSAPADVQRARVLARPNMTVEKFESILKSQVSDAEKRSKAHHIIENHMGLDDTRQQLRDIIAKINPPTPPKGGLKNVLMLAGALLLLSSPALATKPDGLGESLTVVELFTSQGCSSCPPADAYLAELAQRPDILALEYHIDYWDQQLTFRGSWKDPYSKREWSQRQLNYNGLLGLGDRVYTPQMIIDGRYQDNGAKRDAIARLLEKSKQARADDHERAPDMKQAKVEDNILELTVNGEVQGRTLDVVIARFIREAETNVTSGENKNDTLKNHNIVQSLFPLGAYAGGKQSYRYPLARLHAQESCALFLQDQVNKRIVAAQKCLE